MLGIYEAIQQCLRHQKVPKVWVVAEVAEVKQSHIVQEVVHKSRSLRQILPLRLTY